MATYTYTSYTYETRVTDEGKTMTRATPITHTVPIVQQDGEPDVTYTFRMYGTALYWLFQVAEADIPATGPARTVWDQYRRVRAMTDEELSDERYEMGGSHEVHRDDDIGLCVRLWADLLDEEDRRRNAARN